MPLFRALAKNMAPMTNADESPNTFSYLPVSLCSIYQYLLFAMSDEAWPAWAWVNKISVLILYFSFPFNAVGFRNENT